MAEARLTTVLAFAIPALTGCYHGTVNEDVDGPSKTPPAITRTAQAGPCADTSYQRMKRTPADSLSQREFEIFRQRDAACFATQGSQAQAPPPAPRRNWLNVVVFAAATAVLLGMALAH